MVSKLVLLEERLAMAFFAGTSIFVLIGAITRTAGSPVIWAVDLAQLCFAWACVLGADLALKKNAHIEIDIVIRNFSVTARRYLAIIWLIAIAAFLAMLTWYGTQLTLMNTERVLGDVGISYSWVTGAIPTGCALMLATTLKRLYRGMTGRERLSLEGHDGTVI
ncbi:TRAP transporter small permease [Propionivibrio sp.]|jgi:TRAP-type C4-dicarboxylate transport system permease small subunit|uniref:TRAP transporter small permease n=1 Tax=Propionivibrio sp. TaxID=2212460 RepID=UPI00272E0F87|nr:TRAP transporter small permease subunit [Propionivibrio sp.]